MISVFHRVENTVEKGGNCSNQHFRLFPESFQKASPQGRQKSGLCDEGLKYSNLKSFYGSS